MYESLQKDDVRPVQAVAEVEGNNNNNKDFDESAGEEVELEESVYGAAIFSICFDFFEILTGKDHDGLGISLNCYRLFFTLVLLVANYAVQMLLLYWVYSFVAVPAVHGVQQVYASYHAECFDEHGTFSQDAWDSWGDENISELCMIAFSNPPFMFVVLALWWTVMLNEVRKTERDWRNFFAIKSTFKAEEMIVKKDGENLIVCLTPRTKYTLYLFLLAPKMVIAVVLMVVGTVWLTATDSFGDLILNAVALEFIICVDEIIFQGLLPESIKKNVGLTKLFCQSRKKTGDAYQDALHEEWNVTKGWIRSTGYFVAILIGVYLYMDLGQKIPIIGVYPGFKHDADCPKYWGERSHAMCLPGKECFPFGG